MMLCKTEVDRFTKEIGNTKPVCPPPKVHSEKEAAILLRYGGLSGGF